MTRNQHGQSTFDRLTFSSRRRNLLTPWSLRMTWRVALFVIAGLAALPASGWENITLNANRDNNLLQSTTTSAPTGRQFNDVNLGGGPRLAVGLSGGGTNDNRTIVDFDFSPLAGQYQEINSITMRFTYDRGGQTQNYSTPFDIEVYKITGANADWVEGTGSGAGDPADGIGSTWRQKDRGVANWAGGTGNVATGGLTSPGIDYESTLLASLNSGITLPADGDFVDIVFDDTNDLTALMDSLILDASGFVLLTPTGGLVANQDRMRFNTRENADPALRPQLIVNFTAVPEPGAIAIWLLLGLGVVVVWRIGRRGSASGA